MNKVKKIMLNAILALLGLIVLLLLAGWVGLQIRPAPFPAYPAPAGAVETVPLPTGLPAPVERFYKKVYGDRVPVIKSVVITGHAELRPNLPFFLPARFRFTHVAGQAYRHYIEMALFGIPLIKANERYLDGKERMEIDIIGTDEGEKLDQGGNLGMWSESLWFPALYLTDPRVHWEPVDADTAILAVPFNQGQEHYVVRFDPATGLVTWMESMRYQTSTSAAKVLWMNQAVEWRVIDGQLTNTAGAAIWMDDGKPWAVFHLDDIRFNVDVQDYVRQKGL